jgi:glutamyl-tRNA reductase
VAVVTVAVSDRPDLEVDFDHYALSEERLIGLKAVLFEEVGRSLNEYVVLSTCARTEIYFEASEFHSSVDRISTVLASVLGREKEELTQVARVHYGAGAAEHLYRVACGLDSRIVGESEILAQVKVAFEGAIAAKSSGQVMNRLFREAIEVGKKARSSTKLATGSTSIAAAGARLCLDMVNGDSLESRPLIAVVGSGAVGLEVLEVLLDRSVDVVVVTRRPERVRGRDRTGCAEVRALEDLETVLAKVDGVVFATSSPSTILDSAMYEKVALYRDGRPLAIVDLSMPRDVDGEIGGGEAVRLIDLDAVNRHVEAQLGVRLDAVQEVERFISGSLERFESIHAARELSPVLQALYERAESIRLKELEGFVHRSSLDDPSLLAEVDRLTSQVVAKLLHAPATQLRKVVESGRGTVAIDEFKDLFNL